MKQKTKTGQHIIFLILYVAFDKLTHSLCRLASLANELSLMLFYESVCLFETFTFRH